LFYYLQFCTYLLILMTKLSLSSSRLTSLNLTFNVNLSDSVKHKLETVCFIESDRLTSLVESHLPTSKRTCIQLNYDVTSEIYLSFDVNGKRLLSIILCTMRVSYSFVSCYFYLCENDFSFPWLALLYFIFFCELQSLAVFLTRSLWCLTLMHLCITSASWCLHDRANGHLYISVEIICPQTHFLGRFRAFTAQTSRTD